MSSEVGSGDGKATASMVLGLGSVLCMCFTGVPAIALGVMALPNASPAGKTRAKVGIGAGSIMTVVGLIMSAMSDAPTEKPVAPAVVETTPQTATPTVMPAAAPAPTASAVAEPEATPIPNSEPTPMTEPTPIPEPALPGTEQQFCDAVTKAKSDYEQAMRDGANELKLSKIRSARKTAVLAAVGGGVVKGWVAEVYNLSTNGDGKAVFRVKLPCDVHLSTLADAFSDVQANTLIPQSSPLYDFISELNSGDKITISGKLFSDQQDGYDEVSFTEKGSLTDPVYVFKFSAVSK